MLPLAACAVFTSLVAAPDAHAEAADHAAEATKMVQELAQGHPELVAHRFDARMRSLMSDDKLGAVWSNLERSLGPFVRVEKSARRSSGEFETVEVTCRMKEAGLDVQLVFDDAGRISGLFFEPNEDVIPAEGWTPPSYANTNAIVEERLSIEGDDRAELFLTRPRNANLPGPLLIIATAPERADHDARQDAFRPHKDLAFGLASLGVQVVRFAAAPEVSKARLEVVLRSLLGRASIDAERIAIAVRSEALLPTDPTLRAAVAAVIYTKGLRASDRERITMASKAWRALAFEIEPAAEGRVAGASAVQLERYPSLDAWLIKADQAHVHPEVVEDIASFLFRLPARQL